MQRTKGYVLFKGDNTEELVSTFKKNNVWEQETSKYIFNQKQILKQRNEPEE